MEDSDDADEGGASRNSEVLAAGPSDVEAATGYINSMGSAGLSCGPRQLRQQEAPTVGGRLGFTLSTASTCAWRPSNTNVLARYVEFTSTGVL